MSLPQKGAELDFRGKAAETERRRGLRGKSIAIAPEDEPFGLADDCPQAAKHMTGFPSCSTATERRAPSMARPPLRALAAASVDSRLFHDRAGVVQVIGIVVRRIPNGASLMTGLSREGAALFVKR